MSNLIDRQAAIDALNEVVKDHSITDFDAIASILDLPPAQPEPCEDAVSRAEVLRMINCINDHHAITPYKSVGAVTEHLTRIASNLPPAQPKRKKGKWTNENACEFCGFQPWYERDIHTLSFCPNCGADMRGEQDG